QPAAGGDPRRRCHPGHTGGARRRRRGEADHEHDADGRPSRRRRCGGGGVPPHGQAVRGRARTGAVTAPRVWYFVREFDRGRDFYKRLLGFDETYVDWEDKWSKLEHGGMRIAISEGEPTEAGVAVVDVDDVK